MSIPASSANQLTLSMALDRTGNSRLRRLLPAARMRDNTYELQTYRRGRQP